MPLDKDPIAKNLPAFRKAEKEQKKLGNIRKAAGKSTGKKLGGSKKGPRR